MERPALPGRGGRAGDEAIRRSGEERLQAANALSRGWMACEKRAGAPLPRLDRIHNVEVRGPSVRGLEDMRVGVDTAQRIRQTVRIPGELDRRGVRQVLTLAAHRKLQNPGEQRGKHHQDKTDRKQQHAKKSATLVPISPTPAGGWGEARELPDEIG